MPLTPFHLLADGGEKLINKRHSPRKILPVDDGLKRRALLLEETWVIQYPNVPDASNGDMGDRIVALPYHSTTGRAPSVHPTQHTNFTQELPVPFRGFL